jgi:hypothetical protein
VCFGDQIDLAIAEVHDLDVRNHLNSSDRFRAAGDLK